MKSRMPALASAGLIAFWSVSREKRCAGRASDQCSGVDQSKYAFAKTFAGF